MKQLLSVALCALVVLPVRAQVIGHQPTSSPYKDLEFTQEWTLYYGFFHARKDPLDVAPRSGMLSGGRYDVRIGGPVYGYARLGGASLDRRVLDTKQPEGSRYVGSQTVPLLFSDIGLDINLTGFKTWHSFAPDVSGGFGMTTDLSGRSDVSAFRFGSPFTVTYGGGLKWIPGGHWQVRADWFNYIYQIHYPNSYFIRVGTDNPVLLPGQRDSYWRRNAAYQLGISYLFHR